MCPDPNPLTLVPLTTEELQYKSTLQRAFINDRLLLYFKWHRLAGNAFTEHFWLKTVKKKSSLIQLPQSSSQVFNEPSVPSGCRTRWLYNTDVNLSTFLTGKAQISDSGICYAAWTCFPFIWETVTIIFPSYTVLHPDSSVVKCFAIHSNCSDLIYIFKKMVSHCQKQVSM